MSKQGTEGRAFSLARLHLRFGWWTLLCFLTLGIVLEGLHGLKVGWYLDVSNSTRRLMFTLAHTHGTLVALINLAFGLTARFWPGTASRQLAISSRCLLGAGILLPAGFFLGGLFPFKGDPGLGILLVPIGALLLFIGVLLAARGAGAVVDDRTDPAQPRPSEERSKRKKNK